MNDRIEIVVGDITKCAVTAIVNAANTTLLGGGGVDGAIHRAAGPGLLAECKGLGGCPTGEVRLTRGYGLPAQWVIHTVGPVWHGGMRNEEGLLRSCYAKALQLAAEREFESVAFPAISTGVYRFPAELGASIALSTTVEFLEENPFPTRVVIVCFDSGRRALYEQAAEKLRLL